MPFCNLSDDPRTYIVVSYLASSLFDYIWNDLSYGKLKIHLINKLIPQDWLKSFFPQDFPWSINLLQGLNGVDVTEAWYTFLRSF